MTAFSKVTKGKVSQRPNKKDGGPLNRQRDYNAQLEALGFTRTDWNKHSYTWVGEFPVFTLAPGTLGAGNGLVARCTEADKEILFAYGTSPADIAARLNDEILAIMRHDAEIAEMPLDWRPEIGEIDIDAWMSA